MKLGCCSWSYHRAMEAKQLTFNEWLRICADELLVDGVDIIAEQMPHRTKEFCLEVRKRCTDYRLTIASLSPGNDFGKPQPAELRAQVDNINRWIETAVVLGAPILRIFAGWPPAGQAAALWPSMVNCIQAVARTAAHAGVTLAVEPHNHGGFLSNSESTLRLMREINSPWVKINLDTGNYDEPDVYAGLEASLPEAPHVVAKVHDLDARGAPDGLDYDRIFAMLKRRRYHGFVTLEYEGTADEAQTVPRAIDFLRRTAMKHHL